MKSIDHIKFLLSCPKEEEGMLVRDGIGTFWQN